MNTSNLRNLFLDVLTEKLKYDGFKCIRNHREFVRTFSLGQQKFFTHFTKWHGDDGFYIDTGIIIRFDKIEDFYHETSYFEKKYQKGTFTIGYGLDNYLNNGNSVFQRYVTNEKEAVEASEYCYSLYKEIVVPLFDKYNTFESLHILLNSEPYQKIGLVNSIHRGIHAVIVAYILNISESELNRLIKIYSQQYSEMADGFYKPEFDKVVENIKKKKQCSES
jgi:hypothetical protein